MFTKEDYKEYFEQIGRLERAMIFIGEDLLQLLEDAKIRSIIDNLVRDESRHYAYIKSIFNSLLLADETDKRKYMREHSLGIVLISNKQGSVNARCIDISKGGIKIETDQAIYAGDNFKFHISLYGKKEEEMRSGKLIWVKKIDAGCYVGGVQFTS